MLKTVEKRRLMRTCTRSDRNALVTNDQSFYAPCYTLEPGLVEEAWDTLNRDTFAMDIASYPVFLHNALVRTLKKRAKHA